MVLLWHHCKNTHLEPLFLRVYYRKRTVVVCNSVHTHVFVYNFGIYHVLCPFPGILTVLHSILCNLHSGQRVGRDGGPSLHGLHWACAQPKTSPEAPQHLCFYPTLSIRHWIFKSTERYYLFWSWQVSAGWNVFTLTCSLLNALTGICYVLFVDKSLRFFACGCETAVKL